MEEKIIRKFSVEETNKRFKDLLEKKMSKEQFDKWVVSWFAEDMLELALKLDDEIKNNVLMQYKELIK